MNKRTFIKLFTINTFLLISLILPGCSSKEEKDQMILNYQNIKCKREKLLQDKDSIIRFVLLPLKTKIFALEEDYYNKARLYEERMNTLNRQKYEIDLKYTEEYIKISQKHEQKHGHMITPDYQNQIDRLEKFKNVQYSVLDKELSSISFQREQDTSLKRKELQISELKKELKHTENIIQRHYEEPVKVIELQLSELSLNLKKFELGKEKESIDKSTCKM